ncbi:EcsC family protein [Nocardioides sp. HM23]|uniref:EcsC family protein n=1 Tax=Nocardioides bizhenqiangii TaxID=3095076 RepID=UPI002AC9F9BC|nr:EcsC family protein [Nocardioides sp. HM23]MDZ5619553.1 EcsC family protein [Nocardioides sp. HM23]
MASVKRALAGQAARVVVPRFPALAPGVTSSFVREALHRAIVGVGPLAPAAEAAEAQLREQHGQVDKAVHEVIENHVGYASVGGLLANVGGLVTAAVLTPANISGLALIQCRMIAGIAHLRGYDLDDPRVRNAILVTILGEDMVKKMVRKMELPAPPMALATAPSHDPALDQAITSAVASDLIGRVLGKQIATNIGRRVPVVGGVVGAGVDGYGTWKVGRYAAREFLQRRGTA